MGNPEIIRQLKENPNLNVYALSLKIGVSTREIGEAQHQYLINVLASSRKSSGLWDLPGYGKDARPAFFEEELQKATERIHSGENGVVEFMTAKYRINKDYLAKLHKVQKQYTDGVKGLK
jgi:hypothetical protein